MSAKTRVNLARRSFLKVGFEAGAGLTLGVILPPLAVAQDAAPGLPGSGALVGGRFEPNAFVTIAPDNTVTVISKHLEMGQGVYTGLATLVAEELDADWDQVAVSGDGVNALPKLHGALLKNEQDVALFERLAFMARGQR